MTGREVRRYCRAVGSYLPCSRRQKRDILSNLRQRLEDHPARQPDGTPEELFGTPEELFGTPQQVAAAYVDDMDTHELLGKLRWRHRVVAVALAGMLAALLLWSIGLSIEVYDYRQALNGWIKESIVVESAVVLDE